MAGTGGSRPGSTIGAALTASGPVLAAEDGHLAPSVPVLWAGGAFAIVQPLR